MKRLFRSIIPLLIISLLSSACITITAPATDTNTNVTPVVLNKAQQPQKEEQQAPEPVQQGGQQQQQEEEEPEDTTPCNKAKFVSENIPDDKEYNPGDTFTKTWTMRNTGDCTWDETYRVVFNEGDRMGGESSYYLDREVEPGETIEISVHLTAPSNPGTYQGYWNIKAPDGDLFTYFWAKIVVVDNTPPFAVLDVSTNLAGGYDPGSCPYTIDLKVWIYVNGPGTVKFRPETTDLGMHGTSSLSFLAEGQDYISFDWKITYSDTYTIWIHIDEPNNQTFGPWTTTVNCN